MTEPWCKPVRRSALLALAAALLVGCGGGCGGCGTLAPFPDGGTFTGEKADDGVNLRLTAGGLGKVGANWQQLVGALAPGGTLHLPLACVRQSFDTGLPLIGVQDFYLADQGQPDGGGRNDGRCDALDQPADVAVTITGVALTASGGKLDAALSLAVNTGTIYFTRPGTILCDITCRLGFDSTPAPSTLTAVVGLSIDPRWDRLLAFSIDRFDGTQVCGSTGALVPPACLDPGQLTLGSSSFGGGGFCLPASWGCDLLGLAFVKDLLLQLLSPTLQSAIQGLLRTQACRPCGAGQPACPASTDGSGVRSTCDPSGLCQDPAGACVPRVLGTEGTLDLGSLLGATGAAAPVDLSVAAGGSVKVDTGLSLGTRTGVQPVEVALCVPPLSPPDAGLAGPPDFDARAPAGLEYDLGLALSRDFLARFLWSAHQAGALCLSLGTDAVSLLDTGVFRTFLPSLGALATVDGKDAPMRLLLRPARAPGVSVGPGDPLLTLTLEDLALDVYALVADRQVRLFTLTLDVRLPLALAFEGCDTVTPVLANPGLLVSNVRATNSELLTEDPAVLVALVPALVSLAQPALAQALTGFALPPVAGLRLQGLSALGLGPLPDAGTFGHLGLYARLLPPTGPCGAAAPTVAARLQGLTVPTLEALRDGAAPPELLLAVSASGAPGTPEFSVRVDDGLWTAPVPAPAGLLRVAQPALLLEGTHTVEVRTRMAEAPAAVSAPRALTVVIDAQPPTVTLVADPVRGLLEVRARDRVSPAEALRYAYRLGDGPASSFGPPRALPLAELDGEVEVLVQDAAGRVGRAAWRGAKVAEVGGGPPAPLPTGCSTAGPGLAFLATAAWLVARRRR